MARLEIGCEEKELLERASGRIFLGMILRSIIRFQRDPSNPVNCEIRIEEERDSFPEEAAPSETKAD